MTQARRQNADAKAQAALETLNALAPVTPRAAQLAALKTGLAPDLVSAYSRFLTDAVKRDPRYKAKSAIARALVALEAHDRAFYQAGINYRQRPAQQLRDGPGNVRARARRRGTDRTAE